MATPSQKKPRKRRKRRRLSRQQEQRRQILRAAGVAVGLWTVQPLAALANRLRPARKRLRPPGALSEEAFLGACIKCGQCVQVCPVQAPKLADLGDGLGAGSPYLDPRMQACDFSCDALSCVLACPTEALSHVVQTKEEVRAGFARLARPDACLARQGKGFRGRARGKNFPGVLRYAEIDRWNAIPVEDHPYDRETCDLCVLQCPIGSTALGLVPLLDAAGASTGRSTPEVRSGCVGCGVCEMICPAEPAAIVVEARARPQDSLVLGTPDPRGEAKGGVHSAPEGTPL